MKNYKFTTIILALVVLVITGFKVLPDENDYNSQWQKVEEMAKKGQPRSAIKVIDDIYSSAKAEKNTPQIIKALIYKISMESTYTEDYELNSIETFESELGTAAPVEKQLLQSLLAQLYQSYYQKNEWVINERQQYVSTNEDDIITWDAMTFAKKISSLYLSSLKDKELTSSIKTIDYTSIINNDENPDINIWPTLYDLLANRAMEYFSSSDAELMQLSTNLDQNKDYFLPAKEFININIPENNPQLTTLNIFQQLLKVHIGSGNIEALTDVDLRRLNYVYTHSGQDKALTNNYLNALENLKKEYSNQTVFPLIAFQIAKYYHNNAGVYNNTITNSNKDYLVKANNICEEAIAAFPDAKGTNECRNLSAEIEKVSFSFNIPFASMPDKPSLSLVEFRNIDHLYFRLLKSNPIDYAQRTDVKHYIKNLLNESPALSWTQELPETSDYRTHSVEMAIPSMKPGFYILAASDDENFSSSENVVFKGLWLSELSYIISYNRTKGINEIFTLNRETGSPEGNVDITVYQRKYDNKSRDYVTKKIKELSTDKNGYAIFKADENVNYGTFLLMFEKDNNKILSENYLSFYKVKPDKAWRKSCNIFTDRAVYRPGQIVNFKAIFTERNGNEVRLLKNENTEIRFINASGKEISKITPATNSSGSVSGSFPIPQDLLNGRMTIRTKHGSTSITVEEYKLPTFEVVMDSLKAQPVPGDSVIITGKAAGYAGNAINNASVKYVVTKRTSFPIPYYRGWYPVYNQPDIEIANGIVTTNEDGTFRISFITKDDESIPDDAYPIYNYSVHADVTDISGEMQSANADIRIGRKPVIIQTDIENVLAQNENNKGSIIATNLNNASITIDVTAELFHMQQPDRILIRNRWEAPDLNIISKGEFINLFPHIPYKNENDKSTWEKTKLSTANISVSGKAVIPESLFTDAIPGDYFLSITGKDNKGNIVKTGKYITIYSTDSKDVPGNDIYFHAVSAAKAEPGETIKLTVGSAAKKSKIYYEIVNGDSIIESNWIKVSNSQKVIEIPVKEEYRGNFIINTAMVKYNSLYTTTDKITVPFTNKVLDIKLDTYRDYLTPASKEQWTVTINDYQNNKVSANLLAGMYDAALDVYRENNWNMSLYYDKMTNKHWESGLFSTIRSSYLYNQDIDYIKTTPIIYPQINWFGYPVYGRFMYKNSPVPEGALRESRSDIMKMDAINVENDIAIQPADEEVVKTEQESEGPVVPLRKNFNETAFFYPDLTTNDNGETKISFTTPDALTEWKVQVLAYTDDLKTGTYETTIKSKKDLMVIPNLPRFIRTGDTLEFTAKVTNYTENDITAATEIEFFNPVTDKKLGLFTHNDNKRLTNIKALQSVSLKWEIVAPETAGLIAYRIKSHTDNFSDGEEKMFPVLTNRMLVTTTMPMHVSGNSTEDYTFHEMLKSDSKSLQNVNFTVEFASNPAWYAIQALPYLSENNSRSNLSLFNKYYANALSAYIVNSNPKVSAVFESWKSQSPDAFLSNLEKNQELKDIVLEATPWILEAENESQQKRMIGELMNINKMAQEKETILNKLQKEQLFSGAWPWFEGMSADRYTTQTIILKLARLHKKGIIDLSGDQRRLSMVKKAVSYLDKEIAAKYQKLKDKGSKTLKRNNLSGNDIQYLYLRGLLSALIPLPSESEHAYNYYISQSKEYWLKKSNYLQGMIAQYLATAGHRNESEAIVRSLQERSLYNKEMGMYWRSDKGYYWYDAPVETQAMMIETFSSLNNNPALTEQMKIWLLKQKQVQHWSTSSATAEAIFALLMHGDNQLSTTELAEVTVGKQKISTVNDESIPEAGTGYYTHSWKGKEINNSLAKIVVVNPNNHIAWGAAYWQYTEDMDKVKSASTSLSIDKQLFTEQKVDGKMKLVQLKDNAKLRVGDKVIVRLIISSDRDMEYIHVSDMRATCFEPSKQLSGNSYSGGLWYYKNITDTGNDLFIQRLNKGTYVIDYSLYVTQSGNFTNGIATIQSIYAPEFSSHTKGIRIKAE